MQTKQERFAGIDVSKASLDCAVLEDAGSPVIRSFGNDCQGHEQLIAWLRAQQPALLVAEATGGYEAAMAVALATAGLPIAVVNARQARDFAKALGVLAKTDRVDAVVLARFARRIRPAVRTPKPEELSELEALLARRRAINRHAGS